MFMMFCYIIIYILIIIFFFYFFFQAEDGIRDLTVTGVQTCALPISMLGRQTSTGGAIRMVEFRNSANIPPGCTASVSQMLSALKELEFTGYRQSDGAIIPLSGGMVKRLSFVRSVAAVTARRWDEVLHGNKWSLAEAHKRVKDRAQLVGNALASLDAEIVRWCGGVLVPRSTSIAARLR